MQCSPEASHLPAKTGDVKHSRADISAAKERLGYSPLVYFKEGLDRTVRAYVHESS